MPDLEKGLPTNADGTPKEAEEDPLLEFAHKYVGPGYGAVFSYGSRLKVNCVPLFLNIVGPWLLFCLLVGCEAGNLRYQDESLSQLVFWGVCIYVVGHFVYTIAIETDGYDPRWTKVAALNCLIAIVAAYFVGSSIWDGYLEPYHTLRDLKVYSNFDVANQRGSDVQDVGTVFFKAGTIFDNSRAWHYMDKDKLYCVAPLVGRDALGKIVMPESGAADFFVVGVDCCSASSADFKCGAFSDPRAQAGLRVLNNDLTENFRLAVKGAEAEYGFLSTFPVFFEWVRDPSAITYSWRHKGYLLYALAALVMLFFYIFVTLWVVVEYATIGRGPGKETRRHVNS